MPFHVSPWFKTTKFGNEINSVNVNLSHEGLERWSIRACAKTGVRDNLMLLLSKANDGSPNKLRAVTSIVVVLHKNTEMTLVAVQELRGVELAL